MRLSIQASFRLLALAAGLCLGAPACLLSGYDDAPPKGDDGGMGGTEGAYPCDQLDEFPGPQGPGHCYRNLQPAEFDTARLGCQAWGGDLVGIQDFAELGSIEDLPVAWNHWVGGRDVEPIDQVYVWLNGEPWVFPDGEPPWAGGQPAGEPCVRLENAALYTADCKAILGGICERAPAPQ